MGRMTPRLLRCAALALLCASAALDAGAATSACAATARRKPADARIRQAARP